MNAFLCSKELSKLSLFLDRRGFKQADQRTCLDSEGVGWTGVPTPMKKHKAIGSHDPDHLKDHKATAPAFNIWPS